MDRSWNYDHEYFQRMFDRHGRMNSEVVGCIIIIIGMSELNKDDSSSDGSSMPSLQDRAQSDLSSDDDTDSYGDDDMYDDGEWWGYTNVPQTSLVLDGGATIHFFSNQKLLQAIKKSDNSMTIHCGGSSNDRLFNG